MKKSIYIINLSFFVGCMTSSCHNEEVITGFPPESIYHEIKRLNIGDSVYVLYSHEIWHAGLNEDKSGPAKIELFIQNSEIPVKSISTYGNRHESEEYHYHACSENGNIVYFNGNILYCDQWKEFESEEEKNIIVIFDRELNELKRVNFPQSGILRESNGKLLIINRELDYTILDSNFDVITQGRFSNQYETVKQSFSTLVGIAMPIYYNDGISDIISLVKPDNRFGDNIGHVINLTEGSVSEIIWNSSWYGSWIPSFRAQTISTLLNEPLYQECYYNWFGITPYFDYELMKFIYPCSILDSQQHYNKSFAKIDINGTLTVYNAEY